MMGHIAQHLVLFVSAYVVIMKSMAQLYEMQILRKLMFVIFPYATKQSVVWGLYREWLNRGKIAETTTNITKQEQQIKILA